MTREEAIKVIKNFPVESTGERKAVILAIEALEQEQQSEWERDHEVLKAYADGQESMKPCKDAISRTEVLKKAVYTETENGWSGYTVSVEDIKDLPPVIPQEPKTDTWSIKDVADTLAKHGLIVEQEPYDDAISRQDVVKAVDKHTNDDGTLDDDITCILEDIPSVTPQPCEDAISRQAVIDLIEHYNSDGLGAVFYGYEEGVKFADAVNKLPSVSTEKIGHWEMCEDADGLYGICSVCGVDADFRHYGIAYKWCPNCGAKMEVEE